jgi:hypothetical protein
LYLDVLEFPLESLRFSLGKWTDELNQTSPYR